MAYIQVCCTSCKQNKVVNYGLTPQGKQRYYCQNKDCSTKSFILDYSNLGCLPEVKEKLIEMTMNGSGIRDCARVLGISTTTVIEELKKREPEIKNINHNVLNALNANNILIEIHKVEDAELDEMWSYVGSKNNQRWLWYAIDHNTGKILAFVFGERKDEVF